MGQQRARLAAENKQLRQEVFAARSIVAELMREREAPQHDEVGWFRAPWTGTSIPCPDWYDSHCGTMETYQ